jgi:hypothetical protein
MPVVVMVLFLELVLLEFGSELIFGLSHGIIIDTKYRQEQRIKAFENYLDHPSPTTKAAFQEEVRLMHKHEDWKWELGYASWILLNSIWIYYYFRMPWPKTTQA